MPSLRELQTCVLDALLPAAPERTVSPPERALSLIAVHGDAAAVRPTAALARLRIYQNNVRSNFVDALRCSFPVVWRLVGEEYFRRIALEFHGEYPSRSGDLVHAGESFPDYLARLHRDDQYIYLGDVARLEWLVQEALLAAEHAALDLESLARVAPAAYDDLRFELHPTLRLFESRYPALRIWETNSASDAEPEMLDIGGGSDRLAIMRQRFELRFHRLKEGEAGFLDALRRGESFAAAVDCGGDADPEFDASAALQRFVACEALVAFH